MNLKVTCPIKNLYLSYKQEEILVSLSWKEISFILRPCFCSLIPPLVFLEEKLQAKNNNVMNFYLNRLRIRICRKILTSWIRIRKNMQIQPKTEEKKL